MRVKSLQVLQEKLSKETTAQLGFPFSLLYYKVQLHFNKYIPSPQHKKGVNFSHCQTENHAEAQHVILVKQKEDFVCFPIVNIQKHSEFARASSACRNESS